MKTALFSVRYRVVEPTSNDIYRYATCASFYLALKSESIQMEKLFLRISGKLWIHKFFIIRIA